MLGTRVAVRKFDVVQRSLALKLNLGVVERANHPGGRSDHQAARGDGLAGCDHRSGADERTLSDLCTVEHDGSGNFARIRQFRPPQSARLPSPIRFEPLG